MAQARAAALARDMHSLASGESASNSAGGAGAGAGAGAGSSSSHLARYEYLSGHSQNSDNRSDSNSPIASGAALLDDDFEDNARWREYAARPPDSLFVAGGGGGGRNAGAASADIDEDGRVASPADDYADIVGHHQQQQQRRGAQPQRPSTAGASRPHQQPKLKAAAQQRPPHASPTAQELEEYFAPDYASPAARAPMRRVNAQQAQQFAHHGQQQQMQQAPLQPSLFKPVAGRATQQQPSSQQQQLQQLFELQQQQEQQRPRSAPSQSPGRPFGSTNSLAMPPAYAAPPSQPRAHGQSPQPQPQPQQHELNELITSLELDLLNRMEAHKQLLLGVRALKLRRDAAFAQLRQIEDACRSAPADSTSEAIAAVLYEPHPFLQ